MRRGGDEMSPQLFIRNALEPALALLPAKMDTQAGRAMVIAICLQESRIEYRHQIGGPAHGYAQFEQGGGVRGVLTHPASKPHILKVLEALDYEPDVEACYAAIEHNDILACCFARLLLYTLPGALPGKGQTETAWLQYIAAWRPGKPHRATWDTFYEMGWLLTDPEKTHPGLMV